MSIFDVAIAVIFAREFLEAFVIIGQYRRVVLRDTQLTEAEKSTALKTIWIASLSATLAAILTILGAGIALGQLQKKIDKEVTTIIEGVSKLVASVCIAQLSFKIPKWLGLYASSQGKDISKTSLALCFNVAWNIWREIAEIGVFLIPYFLSGKLIALPLSAFVGLLIAIVPGFAIYLVSRYLRSQVALAIFLATVTGFLAAGLFAYGCHELEEVLGETKVVFKITGDFWNHKVFPMALIKPFGYSDHPTVLQVASWWCFVALLFMMHAMKSYLSRRRAAAMGKTAEDVVAESPNNKVDIKVESDASV